MSLRDRLQHSALLGALATAKALRLPVPSVHRHIVEVCDYPMMLVPSLTLQQMRYIDQRCSLRTPGDCRPTVDDVDPRYALTTRDVEFFYQNSYLGPFPLIPPGDLPRLYQLVQSRIDQPSSIYGFHTDRDPHFDLPEVQALLCQPAVTDRVAQLLGPDLLLWRSQIFDKPAGAAGVQWHQASTYMSDGGRPSLIPPDRDALFQVTIWIALDPATRANGCLRLVPGSHDRIRTLTHTRRGSSFYNAPFRLNAVIDPRRVHHAELSPGEFVIFSERAIHGSGANTTGGQRRLGINARYVPTSVAVYRGKEEYRTAHLGQTFRTDKWRAVLARGCDRHGLNRLA